MTSYRYIYTPLRVYRYILIGSLIKWLSIRKGGSENPEQWLSLSGMVAQSVPDYSKIRGKAISTGILSEVDFTESEKMIYIEFADQLMNHINIFNDRYTPIDDLTVTSNSLADLI